MAERMGAPPQAPSSSTTAHTPSSPALPPSRGKGAWAHTSASPQAAGQAKRLRRELAASERRLWAELRKLPLHFRRQVPIGRYIADFASHSARLVVEVDGARHDLPESQLHDLERDSWLSSIGYRVVRVRDARAYEEPERVAEEIASLPPRRGKGRVGGARAAADEDSQAALRPTRPEDR